MFMQTAVFRYTSFPTIGKLKTDLETIGEWNSFKFRVILPIS